MNCKEITNRINDIRSKKNDFDVEFANGDIDTSLKLKSELVQMIKELKKEMWSLEKLTMEEIERQHDEWKELYQNLDPKYKVPSKERIQEFLQENPEFMKLMKTKEKQGFVKLIIAPAPGFHSLKSLADQISQKVVKCGGVETYYNSTWKKMFEEENDICYFATIDKPNRVKMTTNGINAAEIKANPQKYGICDGWMISFTTDEQNIARRSEPDRITGENRIAIVTDLMLQHYIELYFSDLYLMYKGEEAIIPQEYFALFAKDFYEKYEKKGIKVTFDDPDLLGTFSFNWFVSTYLLGAENYPFACWDPTDYRFSCNSNNLANPNVNLGVHSVVRSKLK